MPAPVRCTAPSSHSAPSAPSAPPASIRRSCPSTRRLLVAFAVVGAAVLGACTPSPTTEAPEGWVRATITSDPADVLALSSAAADAVRVDAPATNAGSNSRALFWRADAPVSRDHSVCATVSHSGWLNQEGVALRVAASPHGGVRGITVNKNVWAAEHSVYKVMLWDTSDGDDHGLGIRSSAQHSSVDMRDAVRRSVAADTPRRLCARVSGATLEWKLWPTDVAEPSWDDPVHTARVTLPGSWVYDGSPGLYIGHTPPDGWAEFSAIGPARA